MQRDAIVREYLGLEERTGIPRQESEQFHWTVTGRNIQYLQLQMFHWFVAVNQITNLTARKKQNCKPSRMLSSKGDMLNVTHTIYSMLSVHWANGGETIASRLEAMHLDFPNPVLPSISVSHLPQPPWLVWPHSNTHARGHSLVQDPLPHEEKTRCCPVLDAGT